MLKQLPTKILGCEICGMKGLVKATKNEHREMLRKLSFQVNTQRKLRFVYGICISI